LNIDFIENKFSLSLFRFQIALYNVGKVARQNLIDEFTNVVESSNQPQVS